MTICQIQQGGICFKTIENNQLRSRLVGKQQAVGGNLIQTNVGSLSKPSRTERFTLLIHHLISNLSRLTQAFASGYVPKHKGHTCSTCAKEETIYPSREDKFL